MNIGLYVEHLHGKKTGVGQYGFNITLNLSRLDPENHYYLFTPSPLGHADTEKLAEYPNIKIFDHNALGRLISNDIILIPLWLQFYLPFLCKRIGLDVYLHTGSIWPLLLFRLAKCQVVFIHDVIPLPFPEYHLKHTYYYYRLSRTLNLRNFDRIIVNSETTKKDLMAHFGVPEERIFISLLGKDERFMKIEDPARNNGVREKYGLPESYILFAGTLEPRKNITRLLNAYAMSKARVGLKLVIAGKTGWLYEEVFETVARLNLRERVIFAGFVDDDDLPSIYSMARVFVFPSLYEGFGLPVLEAMACGVPVRTSEVWSVVEVAGEAAVLVDPLNVESLAENIDEVALNDATHDRLCRASAAQAEKFAWEKTARHTLAVLKG
ncbi:MAG: glycosyltransferase [Desulforhopalus sp.]|nr:glycosyltransferase [Desulforhopalus sp.]